MHQVIIETVQENKKKAEKTYMYPQSRLSKQHLLIFSKTRKLVSFVLKYPLGINVQRNKKNARFNKSDRS